MRVDGSATQQGKNAARDPARLEAETEGAAREPAGAEGDAQRAGQRHVPAGGLGGSQVLHQVVSAALVVGKQRHLEQIEPPGKCLHPGQRTRELELALLAAEKVVEDNSGMMPLAPKNGFADTQIMG